MPGDFAQDDQLLRRDLAARHARHDRIGAIFLHVGKEVIVGVLQLRVGVFQHELVPTRGEDRGHGRLADIAATTAAVARDQFLECGELFGAHHQIQILAGIGEVLAQIAVDGDAALLQFLIEDLPDQHAAASTARARLSALLQIAEHRAAAGNGVDQIALADIVTGADLRGVGERLNAQSTAGFPLSLWQDQIFRIGRKINSVEGVLQQRAVIVGVPDEHTAEQFGASTIDHDFFIDPVQLIDKGVSARAGGASVGIAEAGDIDPEELQLGTHIGAGKGRLDSREMIDGDLRHLVARGDESENLTVPHHAFTDRIDSGVGSLTVIVDADAAALADLKTTGAG